MVTIATTNQIDFHQKPLNIVITNPPPDAVLRPHGHPRYRGPRRGPHHDEDRPAQQAAEQQEAMRSLVPHPNKLITD